MLAAASARPLQAFVNPKSSAELSEVIEVIGGEGFPERMLSFLGTVADADHCAIYQLMGLRLDEIGAAGDQGAPTRQRAETVRYEIRRQLNQVCSSDCHVDVSYFHGLEVTGSENAPDRDRQSIMISGKKADAAYCVRILRSAGRDGSSDAGIERIRDLAQILISLTARHAGLVEKKPNLTPALCSLQEIQDCISAATTLSRREAEVCARVLYGMTSYGIALDLGIGKESVMTYRKRAYARLGIGSQRELLMWYLARWSEIRGTEVDGEGIGGATIAAAANDPIPTADRQPEEMDFDPADAGVASFDGGSRRINGRKLDLWDPHGGLEQVPGADCGIECAVPAKCRAETGSKPLVPAVQPSLMRSRRYGQASTI